MTLSNRLPVLIGLLGTLVLAGCDTTEMVPTAPTLTIDWDTIYVYGDCETGRSNTGDFIFDLDVVSDINGTTRVMDERRSNPNTGDSVPMNYSNLQLPATPGLLETVTVIFTATETDPFPLGTDPRMTNQSGEGTHVFSNGRWSNLGSRAIQLGRDADCRVELRYSATSS